MTDLCDEADAEENCQKSFEAAIEADQENPEAWQTKARYLLIRERFDVSYRQSNTDGLQAS